MAKRVSTHSREEWIAIFEAASDRRGDELNDEWRWLMAQLRLSLDYYPAVREALRQGRWKTAEDPKAYIKKVAKCEAARDQADTSPVVLIDGPQHGEFSMAGSLGDISYAAETTEAIRGSDGVWRRGGGRERLEDERHDIDENGNPVSLRGRLMAKLPPSLKSRFEPSPEYIQAVERFNAMNNEHHIHPETTFGINMDKWAEAAGFDEWERQVLNYRRNGYSRDAAMADQPDEESRKALQAAWRRFDRTGKERLREAAEKGLKDMSRNRQIITLDR